MKNRMLLIGSIAAGLSLSMGSSSLQPAHAQKINVVNRRSSSRPQARQSNRSREQSTNFALPSGNPTTPMHQVRFSLVVVKLIGMVAALLPTLLIRSRPLTCF